MIKVNPRHNEGVYEIIWEPVKNVNHGLVSYTVKVLEKEDSKIDSLVSVYLKKIILLGTNMCVCVYVYLIYDDR